MTRRGVVPPRCTLIPSSLSIIPSKSFQIRLSPAQLYLLQDRSALLCGENGLHHPDLFGIDLVVGAELQFDVDAVDTGNREQAVRGGLEFSPPRGHRALNTGQPRRCRAESRADVERSLA